MFPTSGLGTRLYGSIFSQDKSLPKACWPVVVGGLGTSTSPLVYLWSNGPGTFFCKIASISAISWLNPGTPSWILDLDSHENCQNLSQICKKGESTGYREKVLVGRPLVYHELGKPFFFQVPQVMKFSTFLSSPNTRPAVPFKVNDWKSWLRKFSWWATG